MAIETNPQRLYSFISTFIREVTNVREPEKLLSSLTKTVQKIVNCDKVLIVDEKLQPIHSSENNLKFTEEELSMMRWSIEKVSMTTLPSEERNLLIAPLSKAEKALGALVVITSQEPSFEILELIRLFAFLSTVILENLRLYDSLEKQHRVVEETIRYMQQIFNSFSQMIVVFNEALNPVFANIQYVRNEDKKPLMDEIKRIAAMTLVKGFKQTDEFDFENVFYSIVAEIVEYEGERQVLITVTDVTNTKELDRLKQVDRLKTEFIANVSHELRTPLAAIRAYAETMLSSIDELDKLTLKDFVKIIFDESLHLENLLNEILDFARIEQKTLKLQKSWFNLAELCEEVVQSMAEFAKSKQVSLEYDGLSELLIFADRTRLKQVLINLISNGIKYSNPDAANKYVKLRLETSGENVIIVVIDNGIGIPKEYHQRIFEKFFRVQSFSDYKVDGTGLGLAICKEIVELHGGKIWFESDFGKGSTFYVQLSLGE